jgi:hypothetical protein
VLTEHKFKELYEQAGRLRAVGADGAAREVLLFLFDHGENAGGYGVVRLSFVLRELSELAGLNGTSGGDQNAEAKKTRQALEERRDARESAARKGEVDFNQLQELVALNRALGDAQRSMTFYKSLQEPARTQPQTEEIRKMLSGLLHEDILSSDAERIADQIQLERLKRQLLELSRRVEELAAGQPREQQLRLLVISAKALADKHRGQEDLPRDAEEKRFLAELSREIAALFHRHALLRGLPQGDDARARLESLSKDLVALVSSHKINGDLLQDEELRDGIVKLGRKVAAQISEYRIEEDFGSDGGSRLPEYRTLLGEKIARDGLLVYEVLLRIDDDEVAEKVGAWLLAFRQDGEMYSNLLTATKRAKKTDIESRLREEAERLMIV